MSIVYSRIVKIFNNTSPFHYSIHSIYKSSSVVRKAPKQELNYDSEQNNALGKNDQGKLYGLDNFYGLFALIGSCLLPKLCGKSMVKPFFKKVFPFCFSVYCVKAFGFRGQVPTNRDKPRNGDSLTLRPSPGGRGILLGALRRIERAAGRMYPRRGRRRIRQEKIRPLLSVPCLMIRSG